MATAIVSTVLIEDVLLEVSPDLDDAHPAYIRALTALVRPALNQLVRSCNSPERMTSAIAQQRKRLSACPTAVQAFDLFVANMTED